MLSFELGIRTDYYTDAHQVVVDPRLLARWQVAQGRPGIESFRLKAGAGVFSRPPDALQTYSSIGNPDLKAEQSYQFMLGLEYAPWKGLSLDLGGFYVYRSSVIVSSTALVSRDGQEVPAIFSNEGLGQTYGMEVLLQQQLWNGLEGSILYTLSHSTIGSGTQVDQYVSPYDTTHVLAVAATYTLPAQIRLGLRFQYATGAPTTAVNGSIFDAGSNTYLEILGDTLASRQKDYSQLDLRLEKSWSFPGWALTAYLDIRNIYNQTNVAEATTYNYDYSQQQTRSGLPIYPIIGVRGDL